MQTSIFDCKLIINIIFALYLLTIFFVQSILITEIMVNLQPDGFGSVCTDRPLNGWGFRAFVSAFFVQADPESAAPWWRSAQGWGLPRIGTGAGQELK